MRHLGTQGRLTCSFAEPAERNPETVIIYFFGIKIYNSFQNETGAEMHKSSSRGNASCTQYQSLTSSFIFFLVNFGSLINVNWFTRHFLFSVIFSSGFTVLKFLNQITRHVLDWQFIDHGQIWTVVTSKITKIMRHAYIFHQQVDRDTRSNILAQEHNVPKWPWTGRHIFN